MGAYLNILRLKKRRYNFSRLLAFDKLLTAHTSERFKIRDNEIIHVVTPDVIRQLLLSGMETRGLLVEESEFKDNSWRNDQSKFSAYLPFL